MDHSRIPEPASLDAVLQALDQSLACAEFAMDGTILHANNRFLEITGYQSDELVGRNHKIFCTAEFVLSPEYGETWNRIREQGVHRALQQGVRKDGVLFWVDAVYCLVAPAGEDGKIVSFSVDVTERVESSRQKLLELDALGNCFLLARLSPDGAVREVNQNFTTTTGRTQDALQGRDFEALGLMDAEAFRKHWTQALAGHHSAALIDWTSEGRSPVLLETTFVPVFDGDGQVEAILLIGSEADHLVPKESESSLMDKIGRVVNDGAKALIISDRASKTVHVNRAFSAMFGYTAQEFAGKHATFIFGPREQAFLAMAKSSFDDGRTHVAEEVAYCKNGRRLWVSAESTPLLDRSGRRDCVVTVVTDITEAKLQETLQSRALEGMAHDVPTSQLLSMVCQELERLTPGLHIAVYGIERERGLFITSASKHVLNILRDIGPEEYRSYPSGKATVTGGLIHENDIQSSDYPKQVKALFRRLGINSCMSQAVKSSTGKVLGVVTFYETGRGDTERLGRILQHLARICAIIMEREEKRMEMRQLAYFDPVTGLPNRDMLLSMGQSLIDGRARRSQNFSAAVVCVTVDGFGNFSRLADFTQGDAILQKVASRLRGALPGDWVLGRITSDQFAIVMPDCSAKQALDVAKNLQTVTAMQLSVGGVEVVVTTSAGISLYPDNGKTMETLIANAQSSLTQSGRKAKQAVCFFSEELRDLARTSLSLEARLRKALEVDGLYLCYQPQVCLKTGNLYGVEALARWQDPKMGNISPGQFIPIAEKTGLIEKLTDWVLREACRQLGEWRSMGLRIPAVSVNLSAPNFRDPNLPVRILRYLGNNGLKTDDIVLELTESVLLDDDPTVMNTLIAAHAMGLALSMDDFGTGYSSLSYLKMLPLTEIKLDQSFVRDVHIEESSSRLSQAVMHIGQGLNVAVLAEGVETKEQFDLLKKQQCSAAQGYFLSKPLVPDDLRQWVKAWRPQILKDQHSLM